NVNREREARNNLIRLRQDTKTAEEFFILFNEYYLRSGFNEQTAIFYLQNGAVNKNIVSRILLNTPLPSTLSEWQDKIILLD
ncbi:hypothetical protein BDN70DRAFT_770066, partial [Pholiota conissans]